MALDVHRILFVALFLSAFLVAFVHRVTAHKQGGSVSQKEEGLYIFIPLRILGLVGWLTPFVYIVKPSWLTWATVPLSDWVQWIGAGLALAGITLALMAARTISSNVTRTVVTRAEHRLVTHGPYRFIRHPLYTAGSMLFIGLGLLSANILILLVWLVAFLLIVVRTPIEEQYLIAAFGNDYETYMQRTGRYLPKLGKLFG